MSITVTNERITCRDCGASVPAYGTTPLIHYPGCEPGDAEKWERYYEQPEEEEPEEAMMTCDGCRMMTLVSHLTNFPVEGRNFFYCLTCMEE